MTAHTRKEAADLIEAAPPRSKFAVHLQFDIPMTNGNTGLAGGRGYTLVTRKEAMRIVRHMFKDSAEEMGSRVPMAVKESGGESPFLPKVITYWIG